MAVIESNRVSLPIQHSKSYAFVHRISRWRYVVNSPMVHRRDSEAGHQNSEPLTLDAQKRSTTSSSRNVRNAVRVLVVLCDGERGYGVRPVFGGTRRLPYFRARMLEPIRRKRLTLPDRRQLQPWGELTTGFSEPRWRSLCRLQPARALFRSGRRAAGNTGGLAAKGVWLDGEFEFGKFVVYDLWLSEGQDYRESPRAIRRQKVENLISMAFSAPCGGVSRDRGADGRAGNVPQSRHRGCCLQTSTEALHARQAGREPKTEVLGKRHCQSLRQDKEPSATVSLKSWTAGEWERSRQRHM